MNSREKEEFGGLYARLEDLLLRADRGEVGISPFLSPRELHYGSAYLTRKGVSFHAYGGFEEAERRRLYLLPEYMTMEKPEAEPEAAAFTELLRSFGFDAGVVALRILGSGYRALTHRDFLGSLLGLGLDRGVVGDILVEGDTGVNAIVFCEAGIADFIEYKLTKVASDKVRVIRPDIKSIRVPERKFAAIHDTVASPRLDSVIAALCGFSREKARETVCGGLVEMNFESEDRPDRTVSAQALISVRGVGRFRILSLNDRTKKGRYRLEAEQYR